MSHLDYYIKHNISPVRYDLSSLDAHFQRRGSLYRSLGLLPLTFRHADVLEVAVGSGQNSLYVASLQPRSLALLEPNPRGIADIRALYANQTIAHTAPTLIEKKLEDFQPDRQWDIVLCENWLGSSVHERGLLRKLGSFVAREGLLVVTAVSPIGFVPNMIRRAIAARITRPEMSFEERTQVLVGAFASHLGTIDAMTRSVEDWVQDNMINPAYFDLCLPVPMILDELGKDFQVVGSNPVFARDWRWFKSLHGENRQFNAHFLQEYWGMCHGFIDYREIQEAHGGAENRKIEGLALKLIEMVRAWETQASISGAEPTSCRSRLQEGLMEFLKVSGSVFPTAALEGLEEAAELLGRSTFGPEDVAGMQIFSGLFGRETLYVSLHKE